ncbi:MAG: DUF2892 domain-containing protein [Candidatus Polarisedimenticolaceae bacterium]|nr:DUF2892 domain-containing protein [Candidatus Polarisedimenticolaceae bacterium]
MEKSDLNPLSLATVSILREPPGLFAKLKEQVMVDAMVKFLKKNFPSNVEKSERAVRIACGVVLIAASFMDFVTRDQAFWLVFVGWLSLMSGVVSHCPVYRLFGINTAKKD